MTKGRQRAQGKKARAPVLECSQKWECLANVSRVPRILSQVPLLSPREALTVGAHGSSSVSEYLRCGEAGACVCDSNMRRSILWLWSCVSCVCVRPAALWARLTSPCSCGSRVSPFSCVWEKLWFKWAAAGLPVPAPFQWGRPRWQGSWDRGHPFALLIPPHPHPQQQL